MPRPSVLFVCTHNSARSQLAEAILRHRHGDRYEAHSAGTEQTQVKPEALAVLAEAGVPTDGLRSKRVESFGDTRFDYVVTVCDSAKEACPFVPASRGRVHAPFTDPSNVTESQRARLDAFRAARDLISAWVDTVFAGTVPDFAAAEWTQGRW